jgi:hypothetical protein
MTTPSTTTDSCRGRPERLVVVLSVSEGGSEAVRGSGAVGLLVSSRQSRQAD